MNTLFVHSFETSLGKMYVASTKVGLAVVSLPGQSRSSFEATLTRRFPRHRREGGGVTNHLAGRQIKECFKGKRRTFTITLDIGGTEFQRLALQQVRSIRYGCTMSYGQIAESIGHPKASRAVGSANARNLLPIVIPCHRVVASHGLGGYGGGLAMKIRLLQLEGALSAGKP